MRSSRRSVRLSAIKRRCRSTRSTTGSRSFIMSKATAVHALSAVLASVILVAPVRPVAPAAVADGAVAIYPVPPAPSPEAVDAAANVLGNPLNKPVTGAAEVPAVIGGERPPSLETLQAV